MPLPVFTARMPEVWIRSRLKSTSEPINTGPVAATFSFTVALMSTSSRWATSIAVNVAADVRGLSATWVMVACRPVSATSKPFCVSVNVLAVTEAICQKVLSGVAFRDVVTTRTCIPAK